MAESDSRRKVAATSGPTAVPSRCRPVPRIITAIRELRLRERAGAAWVAASEMQAMFEFVCHLSRSLTNRESISEEAQTQIATEWADVPGMAHVRTVLDWFAKGPDAYQMGAPQSSIIALMGACSTVLADSYETIRKYVDLDGYPELTSVDPETDVAEDWDDFIPFDLVSPELILARWAGQGASPIWAVREIPADRSRAVLLALIRLTTALGRTPLELVRCPNYDDPKSSPIYVEESSQPDVSIDPIRFGPGLVYWHDAPLPLTDEKARYFLQKLVEARGDWVSFRSLCRKGTPLEGAKYDRVKKEIVQVIRGLILTSRHGSRLDWQRVVKGPGD